MYIGIRKVPVILVRL